MMKLRKYLLGRKFILRTDHRALISLLSQRSCKTSSARTERWREKVSCFDYDIEYVKGKDNEIADWLSRSTEITDHTVLPLKEEYVINEVRARMSYPVAPVYSKELKQLTEIIEKNLWTADKKKKWSKFWSKADRLSVLEGRLFLDGTKFVPEKAQIPKILLLAYSCHKGTIR